MMTLQTRTSLFFTIVLAVQSSSPSTPPKQYFITNGPSGRRLYAEGHWNCPQIEGGVGAAIGSKSDDQKWTIECASGGACQEFYLRHVISQCKLYATSDDFFGACANDHGPNDNQLWVFEVQSDGSFHIKNKSSGRCLFARSNANSPGEGVGADPAGTVSEDNKWYIESTTDRTPFIAVEISYDLKNITQQQPTDVTVSLLNTTNRYASGGPDITKTYSYEYQEGRSTTFNASATLSTSMSESVSMRITDGLPEIASVGITAEEKMSVEASATVGGGTTWNETTTTKISDTIVCTPQKRVEVVLTQSQLKLTIPIIAVYKDGTKENVGQLVVKHGMKSEIDMQVHCVVCDHEDNECTCPGSNRVVGRTTDTAAL